MEDSTAPVITITGLNPQTIEVFSPYIDEGATALDAVAGNLTASIATSSNVNVNVLGAYAVIYSVSDTAGNLATSSRIVNVVDMTPPILTLIGSTTVSVEVGGAYIDPGASATDNYDNDLTPSITTSSNVNVNVIGTYAVNFSVSDSSGNTATATRVVSVVDTTIPVITLIGSSTIIHEAGIPYIDEGATATDNYDGIITGNIATSSTVNTAAVGNYEVRYNVQDSSMNAAVEVVRVVQVRDTISPVIILIGSSSETTEFGVPYTDAGASVTDTFDLAPTLSSTSTVNVNALGAYEVRYNAQDSSGNAALEVIRAVTVQDTIAPLISLNGNNPQTVEGATDYIEAGATATDNMDGAASVSINASTVSTTTVGSYFVIYSASDISGNTASTTRTVNVVDTTPPSITLNGSSTITIEKGSAYIDAGATATDTISGELTGAIASSSNVNENAVGSYQVVFSVFDGEGNTASTTRSVIVQDTIAPDAPVLTTTSTTLNADSIVVEGTAEANSTIMISGGFAVATGTATGGAFSIPVGLTQNATNTLAITATDISLNVSSGTLLVIVEDSTPPSAPTIDNSSSTKNADTETVTGTAEANALITITGGAASATTTAAGGVYSVDAQLNQDAINTLLVTATDRAGNVSLPSVLVITEDSSPPAVASYTLNTSAASKVFNPASSSINISIHVNQKVKFLRIYVCEEGDATCDDGTAKNWFTADLSFATSTLQTWDGTSTSTTTVLDGTYKLKVRIEDEASNVTEEVLAPHLIVVDTISPIISGVTNGEVTNEDRTITFSDATSIPTATLNGVPFASGSVVSTENAYTFIVTDEAGNSTSSVFTIDKSPPTITLIGSSTVTLEVLGEYIDAGATANDTIAGNLTNQITSSSNVNTSALGQYAVIYTVSDAAGNTTSTTRSVIVRDTTPPVITLIGSSTLTIELGTPYTDAGASVADSFDPAPVLASSSTVNINAVGTYSVTYNAVDSSGNMATSVTRLVQVEDSTAPAGLTLNPVAALTNATPQTINGNKEANSSVWLNNAEIVALDTETTWTYALALAEGENALSLTSKDISGNESAAVTSAIIFDTEAPEITGVINNASYNIGVTPIFGDENGIAGATLNSAPYATSSEITSEGAYTLIVTDNAGNIASTTFTLDITVPSTPTINPIASPTSAGAQTISGGKDADTAIVVNGVEAVAQSATTTWSASVNLATEGDNTFSVQARDAAGNLSSSTVIVIVRDTTGPAAPTSSVPAGNYNTAISFSFQGAPDAAQTYFTTNGLNPTATSTRYLGGTITINGNDNETKILKGVSFDALQNKGATLSINYLFDKSAPIITINGSSSVSVEQGYAYRDEGATANDAIDGEVSANIASSTNLNNLIVGTYSVIYSVSDVAGNTASTTRIVNVTLDVTAPTVILNGSSTISMEQGSTYFEAGASATDIVDSDISANIIITNPVNTNVPNTYTITYSITDSSGNSTSTERIVIITPDATPPIITLLGASTASAAGGKLYNDAGATATDNIDGTITSKIIATNPVDTSIPGTYTIQYNVTDTKGNAAEEKTRSVSVVNDITSPVIAITGSSTVQVELGGAYFDQGATALDNADGSLPVVATSSVNTDIAGGYIVEYSAKDSSGNTASASRVVNVADTKAPVITIAGSKTINILASSTYSDAGASVTDNDPGFNPNVLIIQHNVNTNTLGSYSVFYEATDQAGNTTSITRIVSVVPAGTDLTPPVITLVGSSTISVNLGEAYTDAGASATDDTDGPLSVIATSTVNIAAVGEYEVRYNATDAAGNAAPEAVRLVRVVDRTAPVITLLGSTPVNVKKNSAYVDAGASAMDNYNGDISTHVIASSSLNTAATGTYAVAYNVSDAAGNAATPITRVVNVNDLSTPVISNITPTNSPLFIFASSSVQFTMELSDADDARVSYKVEISSTDPDTSHWPVVEKFTPVEPSATLSNFNAIGTLKFTIRAREFWNNATLRITARDRDGNEAVITKSVRTRPS
ncbi:DUF5011 domain-containing protein [Candidatus Kaiserbacteria bacterium]|nr:DUF5011 domain-containing protein [Candidatus Kaiserbacteria bacterium]